MIYQPPVGARDLFPLDVAQKRWIEDRIQDVFHRWGYHRIITSTLERLDTLMAGGAVEPATVIQLQVAGEALGLRPELTASIARAAATRMAGVTHPLRLYYTANVFRHAVQGIHNRQPEFYQAGVELLGTAGVAADAEVLLMLADCVDRLGLDSCYLVLGDAGLTRSLLSPFPDAVRHRVREAIATLDRVALEALPLSPDLRERALLLLDLRGQPAQVLQQVAHLDLDAEQQQTVHRLKSLIDLLHHSQPATAPTPILDLSLIQPFDYYTGIVFEVVSGDGARRRVIGQGGRYDRLLSLYHPQGQDCPGIGFVLNIEDLHQVLLATRQLPNRTPPSHWLVVPATPDAYAAAFAYAQKIRDSEDLIRVEVELGMQESPAAVRDYARQRQISQIAWVNEQGLPTIETLEQ